MASIEASNGFHQPDPREWIRSVVTEFERPLTLYAQRMVGDLDCARDVVQETFLRLCTEERERIEGHLTEWLFTVCRTRALDSLRKEKRMSVLMKEQAQASARNSGHIPVDAAEMKETEGVMLEALRNLSENQQEVLRLKFQHGMSYREISRITRLSVTNVGFLIHSGLKAMRARLLCPDGRTPVLAKDKA